MENRHCEHSEAIQPSVLLDCFAVLAMTAIAEFKLNARVKVKVPRILLPGALWKAKSPGR
jgi:hypothetical protein